VGKPRQILEACKGKEEEYAEKKLHFVLFLVLLYFVHHVKIHVSYPSCLNVDLLGRGTASAELLVDLSEHHFC